MIVRIQGSIRGGESGGVNSIVGGGSFNNMIDEGGSQKIGALRVIGEEKMGDVRVVGGDAPGFGGGSGARAVEGPEEGDRLGETSDRVVTVTGGGVAGGRSHQGFGRGENGEFEIRKMIIGVGVGVRGRGPVGEEGLPKGGP